MKRISIWIVLLALTPSITQARWYHSSRYRVRYSPYAFQYGTTGLVPGGIKYCPYAVTYGHSGLVFEGTRYTPYAFTYDNPGLVVDYSVWPIAYHSPSVVCVSNRTSAPARCSSRSLNRTRPARACARAVSTKPAEQDKMTIIRQYLSGRGIEDVGINRVLKIDGRLVSADFKLRDRNLVVKYWNPEEIDSLSAKIKFKQKAFERYKDDWQSFAKKHKENGGAIFTVEATDQESIVAALDSCDQLKPGGLTQENRILYAKE